MQCLVVLQGTQADAQAAGPPGDRGGPDRTHQIAPLGQPLSQLDRQLRFRQQQRNNGPRGSGRRGERPFRQQFAKQSTPAVQPLAQGGGLDRKSVV